MIVAPFSAIMIVGALVLVEMTTSIIDTRPEIGEAPGHKGDLLRARMAACDIGLSFQQAEQPCAWYDLDFELGMPVSERSHARRPEDAAKPMGSPMRTVPVIGCPSLLTVAFTKS
jgi:hypothetical protein